MVSNVPMPPPSGALPQVTQADLSDTSGVPAINASDLQDDLGYKNGVPKITVRPQGVPVHQEPMERIRPWDQIKRVR